MKKISVLFLAVSFLASAAIAQNKKVATVQPVKAAPTENTQVEAQQHSSHAMRVNKLERATINKSQHLQAEPVKAEKAVAPMQTTVEQKAQEIKK